MGPYRIAQYRKRDPPPAAEQFNHWMGLYERQRSELLWRCHIADCCPQTRLEGSHFRVRSAYTIADDISQREIEREREWLMSCMIEEFANKQQQQQLSIFL